MTVETSEQVPLQMLQDKATRLRIDSVQFYDRGWQWTPDQLHLRGRDHVRAFLFRDALRSSRSAPAGE